MECLTYVVIPDHKRRMLASGAYECVFIEYSVNNKAYGFCGLVN